MIDFSTLIQQGIIGFYQSCEVTEIFLYSKCNKSIFNFFTIVVFEEKPYNSFNKNFLCDRIPVNNDFIIGIQRYWLTIDEVENKFDDLKSQNKWSSNGKTFSQFPQLKYLPKQYIPSIEGNRINNVLKNNFHNGSYILEFFDEAKSNLNFLIKINALNKLNEVCRKIKEQVPIDLSVVRDRIGNFIFQFPITLINTHSKALSSWDGVDISFTWHHLLSALPDCLLQVESVLDKNYMGSVIEEYNKTNNQKVIIGILDKINYIKIWRKEPNLILSSFSGTYIRGFNVNLGVINPEPRIFEINGNKVNVQVTTSDKNTNKDKTLRYTDYINNNLYDDEKRQMERKLAFKQYNKCISENALNDIRKLIKENDENGVYLWDPFLTANDILKTLYYSSTVGIEIKAIGSFSSKVKRVYTNDDTDKKHKSILQKIIQAIIKLGFKTKGNNNYSWKEYLNQNEAILDNPNYNNFGLNIEFRLQHTNHGWAFHDRFLIFPSSEYKRAKVYSLGTSINSYGINHHILQEVSHPQPVVDAFNELWDKLNHPDCLVWKYPK